MSDPEIDAGQLRAAARAYLEWEVELTGFGLPPHVLDDVERGPTARPAHQVRDSEASRAAAAVVQASPVTAVRVASLEAIVGAPERKSPPAAAAPAQTEVQARATLAALAAAPAGNGVELSDAPADGALRGDKRTRLEQLSEQARSCTRCALAQGRTQTVFARGNPDSPVVFIGEGPGQEEDRTGVPFVGPAGQLLDKMVAAMGFQRDEVYICNVVKCRPPGNRTPLPSEAGACAPFLLSQLDVIQPSVIVALGRCAAENMGLVQGGGWRGRWGKFRDVDVMPTYHPAFLLRSPEFKRPVWEDLQKVMSKLKEAR